MKAWNKLKESLSGLIVSINRYPLTTLFLVLITIINAIAIEGSDDYSKWAVTFLVGAFLSLAAQAVCERLMVKSSIRIASMGLVIMITVAYYLMIASFSELDTKVEVRTAVAIFILAIAYLWIPTMECRKIKKYFTINPSRFNFNETFMAFFKAFFMALFYSLVLFLGTALVIAAVDNLIISMDWEVYSHAANLIFVLFAPILCLSVIPFYSNPQEEENLDIDVFHISIPKFLETLLSYVIIPITSIFTLILLLYVIINISGEFWTDNLLEPMLVSYSLTVIMVYLLSAGMDNKFVVYFRKIFPKVLIPIVLFQTVASILKIGDAGITHGRYYVILFGLFATIAGVLFSRMPVTKNGIIAPILMFLALISIIPPVDAFTMSRVNQTGRLAAVLKKNNMLVDNRVKPKAAVSEEDQEIIISAMRYLNKMQYTDDIAWLASYQQYESEKKFFGFGNEASKEYMDIYVNREQEPISIEGYDYFLNIQVRGEADSSASFEKNGSKYLLENKIAEDNQRAIFLVTEDKQELLRFDLQQIYDRYLGKIVEEKTITMEEATFTKENDLARLAVVVENAHISENEGESDYQEAEISLLVDLK